MLPVREGHSPLLARHSAEGEGLPRRHEALVVLVDLRLPAEKRPAPGLVEGLLLDLAVDGRGVGAQVGDLLGELADFFGELLSGHGGSVPPLTPGAGSSASSALRFVSLS